MEKEAEQPIAGGSGITPELKNKPKRTFGQTLFLVCFGVVMSFAMVEIGVRVLKSDIAYQPDPDLIRSLRPSVERKIYGYDTPEVLKTTPEVLSAKPYLGMDYTNNLGFRMKEDVPPKAPGEKRLLFFGDSYTEAGGEDDGDRFYSLTQKMLRDSSSTEAGKWRIINGGIQNGSPAQYILQMKRFLPLVQPDIVVAFFAPNDLADDYNFENRFGFAFDERGIPTNPLARVRLWLLQHFWTLRYVDVLTTQKLHVLDRLIWPNHLPADQISQAGDVFKFMCGDDQVSRDWFNRKTGKYLEEMKRLAEASGAKFTVSLTNYMFPFRDTEATYTDGLKAQYKQLDATGCKAESGQTMRDFFASFFEKENIPYDDPYNALAEQKNAEPRVKLWNYYDYHYSPAGHKVIAQELFGFLKQLIGF
ncbi:MAG: SGNH/GDSL hydrolase family protein, partial [Candidatus Liptonbacteria bacterium]|nr:SGNH/GDSL hydrolase family protein [Candidatus Liptonbacteria bacterium]